MSMPSPVPPRAAGRLPASDVSPWVGVVGLVTLLGWIAFARLWPELATAFDLSVRREPRSAAHSALVAMALTGADMAACAFIVDKVHRRSSTGIDWNRSRRLCTVLGVSATKLAGLWASWLVIAAFYCFGRWYWGGSYLFA